jgi:putative DNA primase/helicase
MAGKLPDGLTFRTIDQAKWSGLTTKKAIEDALGWLEDSGWIRATDEPAGKRGGRPTVRYTIHPDLPRLQSP